MNVQSVTFKNTLFVNVTSLGPLEIKYLKSNFGLSSLHIDDYINKTQIPKIEVTKPYSLIVLDFPYFSKSGTTKTTIQQQEKPSHSIKSGLRNISQATIGSIPSFSASEKRKRIFSSQIDFIVGNNFLIVLHDNTLSPIEEIFALCQKALRYREKYMNEGPVFLCYSLIDALVDNCFPVVNEIYGEIDKIDKDIDEKQSQATIESISVTRRNIVFLHTTIKPMLAIFKQLEEGLYKPLNGSMQLFWGNILDHLQKIWDRVEDSRELVEGISDSYESFLTSKTNEIVKILTIFSAIVLPLNLFASIYGMNIRGLPYAQEFFSFPLLVAVMILTAVFMLLIFKLNRWF